MDRQPSPQESIKQEITEGLHYLKTGYKNGIPDEVKHSTSPDSGWKVQRGVWFQAVAGRLGNILRRQYTDEALLSDELYDELFAYYRNLTSPDHPLKSRLTQQSDIDEAEAMIDKLIAELEK